MIYPLGKGYYMIKADTLPNYFNGKLYKRWESVKAICGDNSILASKTASDGSAVQLFLTGEGRKRELFFSDGKIMDILDATGIKRVYKYRRVDDETIKGQMVAGVDKNGRSPLILAAKWILKNMVPEKLILKINKEHPASEVFIPKEAPDGTPIYTGKINKFKVVEVMAKDFDEGVSSVPKTILLKTAKGHTEPVISGNGDGNAKIAHHFGISSDVLGQNIRTVV